MYESDTPNMVSSATPSSSYVTGNRFFGPDFSVEQLRNIGEYKKNNLIFIKMLIDFYIKLNIYT